MMKTKTIELNYDEMVDLSVMIEMEIEFLEKIEEKDSFHRKQHERYKSLLERITKARRDLIKELR